MPNSSFLQQCKRKYTAKFHWTSCPSLCFGGLDATLRQGRESGDGPVELCSVLTFALMEEGESDGFLKE
jgi:hypothetical protein